MFVFTKVCVSLYIIYYTHKQHYTFKVHRKKTRTRRRSERRNGGCVKSSFYVFFYSQFLFSLVSSQVCSHSNPKGCLSLRFLGAITQLSPITRQNATLLRLPSALSFKLNPMLHAYKNKLWHPPLSSLVAKQSATNLRCLVEIFSALFTVCVYF